MPVRIASYSPNVAVGENTFYNDLSYMTAMGILVKGCNDGLKTYTKSKPKPVAVVEEHPAQEEYATNEEEEEYEEYENEDDIEETEETDAEPTPKKPARDKDDSGNVITRFFSGIRKRFGDILEVVDDTPDSDDSNNKKSSNYKNL